MDLNKRECKCCGRTVTEYMLHYPEEGVRVLGYEAEVCVRCMDLFDDAQNERHVESNEIDPWGDSWDDGI